MIYSYLLLVIIWISISLYHFIDLLKFFQLEEYDSVRFLSWSFSKWKRIIRPLELIAVLLLLVVSLSPNLITVFILTLIITIVAMSATYFMIKRANIAVIKPLVYTARVKRLLGVEVFVIFLQAIILVIYTLSFQNYSKSLFGIIVSSPRHFVYSMALLFLLGQFTFLGIVLVNILLYPIEALLRHYFIATAKNVLTEVNPIVIGITGSYGKTSTKEILGHILSTRYDVLRTPKSYNTIMGICKVIREELKPHHRYLIVEMGAYKPGEIANICKLVHPKHGILTAIGPQHLERFKTIYNVAKAKNELILSLPKDGVAVFNYDDPICYRLSKQANVKVRGYGTLNINECDIFAQNIVVSKEGTQFKLNVLETNEQYNVKITLLGRYNVSNIMAAILVAKECGISLRESFFSITTLTPFAHRLQPIISENGIFIIDDSYNSNPLGAEVALEILGSFGDGRKILVTPGYAELGTIQEEEHEKFGLLSGVVCDYIILVGNEIRTFQIRKGVLRTKIDPTHVLCYNSLSQAKEFLRAFLRTGDTVLFENDLPDNYL